MKTRVLLIAVLAALLLSSCTHKNKKLAETATPIAETIENQIPERAVDEIQEETGCYESPHISLNYSPDVLEVHETAVSNNGETYLITFTERGTNDGAFPRLDIMSVKMAGFSEVLTAESAEYDFGSEFRQFSEGILSAYYLPEGKLGSVNTALIEMCEPQIESDVEDLLCKTKASIAALLPERINTKEITAHA